MRFNKKSIILSAIILIAITIIVGLISEVLISNEIARRLISGLVSGTIFVFIQIKYIANTES